MPWRRFDGPALLVTLEVERTRRGLTWERVAEESGVSTATIRRLRGHGRFEVDGVLFLAQWLGRPVEEFTRADDPPPDVLR